LKHLLFLGNSKTPFFWDSNGTEEWNNNLAGRTCRRAAQTFFHLRTRERVPSHSHVVDRSILTAVHAGGRNEL
jgi:hypothetical protein